MNLGVKAEFAGNDKRGRKSSLNLCRKFAGTQAVDAELRREAETFRIFLISGIF
jgi:hypothetical protein